MTETGRRSRLLVALIVACTIAALTLTIGNRPIGPVVYFLVPGLFGAMALSGNVHAIYLWPAALVNFVFYFLLCWTAGALFRKIARDVNHISELVIPEPKQIDLPMLSADAIAGLQDDLTREWHSGSGEAVEAHAPDWLAGIPRPHPANFDPWHIDTGAPTPAATDA